MPPAETPPALGHLPLPPPLWSAVLRALREARDVTQEGWAAQLGVARRTVQRWEQGLAVPDALAEAAILAYCQEKGLFRRYERGVLAGVALTPGWLENLLTEARLQISAPPAPRRALTAVD